MVTAEACRLELEELMRKGERRSHTDALPFSRLAPPLWKHDSFSVGISCSVHSATTLQKNVTQLPSVTRRLLGLEGTVA